MNTSRHIPPRAAASAFTLIELIGVLAIISIMAAVIAPNVLRSLDRAAVTAEFQSMHNLGEQVKQYLRNNAALPATAQPPASPNWTAQLANYADLAPNDVAINKRNNARVFLVDPATVPAQRAIILSSMRSGLGLPTAANINNAVRFQDIWQTADGSVPTTVSWNGWTAWNAVAKSGDYLVIERVSLLPIYLTDLQNQTIALNNNAGASASYRITTAGGVVQAVVNIAAGQTVTLPAMHKRDRIDLYRSSGGANLDYSYVLSDSGKTFDFDGTQWSPQ